MGDEPERFLSQITTGYPCRVCELNFCSYGKLARGGVSARPQAKLEQGCEPSEGVVVERQWEEC